MYPPPAAEKAAESLDTAALNQALHMMLESIQQGKDFVLAQAPIVVQEIVAYGRATHTVYTVVAALATIALGFTAKWAIKRAASLDRTHGEQQTACGVGAVFSIVAAVILVGISFYQADYAMQAWFAPRLYVLEYIHRLVS